jgi:ABC-type nitrate/sulfonate/bicarbonate transport system permease component
VFATQPGLGYDISLAGGTLLDHPGMYAGILAISLLGLYFTVDAPCPGSSWVDR